MNITQFIVREIIFSSKSKLRTCPLCQLIKRRFNFCFKYIVNHGGKKYFEKCKAYSFVFMSVKPK